MSQEERDQRLGLTGLTPQEREKRIEELERELAAKQQAAREKLQAARAQRVKPEDR
jgi:hypothetical protein